MLNYSIFIIRRGARCRKTSRKQRKGSIEDKDYSIKRESTRNKYLVVNFEAS